MSQFTACKCPPRSPWGKTIKPPLEVAPGIWQWVCDLSGGLFMSRQRSDAIEQIFPQFRPNHRNWWNEEEDMAVAIAAFHDLYDDRACWLAYHSILSNAQWEKRFEHVATECHDMEVKRRSMKYAADNKRFYICSSVIVYGNVLTEARMVRKADGHAVTVLYPTHLLEDNRFFSEAEVSMHLVAPDL
jgi:hypothetical protein